MSLTLPLFNINGLVGCGPCAKPDFPKPADILNHMNRLGVARALLRHTEARDLNPTYGNRRLLNEIAATADAGRRLVPAFTVNPALFFDSASLAWTKEMMAAGRVRALALVPGTARNNIGQIERVLRELLPYRPVLMLDIWDVTVNDKFQAALEIGRLADTFPSTPIICCQGMWWQFGALLDLMWRHSNILIDTSWMHMYRGLEITVRHFGAERLVFGLGPRAHQGAAIGALVQADLDESAKSAIGHINLERLLGLDATGPAVVSAAEKQDRSLWAQFIGRRPLQCPVIDAHAHLHVSAGWIKDKMELQDLVAFLKTHMDRLGFKQTLLISNRALSGHPVEGNREIAELFRNSPAERVRGYVVYNPRYRAELQPRLDDYFADPFFIGFKVLSEYWNVALTHADYQPMLTYANQHGLPVLIHTWEGEFSSPAILREIVRRYPQAVFLLGHSGGGNRGRQEAVDLVREFSNVFLEWCGSFTSSIPWEQTLSEIGPERLVFGTDTLAHDPAWELGRLLSLEVPESTLIPILGPNMRKIFSRRR